MSTNTISILEGNTFVVSDRRGDIEGSPTDTQGFFTDDTRFLSRWVLTANGIRPSVLSTDDVQYFEAKFFLAPSSGTIYVDVDMSIMRKRVVGRGFREEIVVENHSAFPKEIDVKIEAAADFADLFEVKDQLKKKGEYYRRVDGDTLVLGYKRESYVRETHVKAPGATFDEAGLRYKVTLEPHVAWSTTIDISVVSAFEAAGMFGEKWGAKHDRARQIRVDQALAMAPKVRSDWLPLIQTYQRSIVDTAALRYFPILDPSGSMPAAGLPWFMAVFGRDSIIMSLQTLPFVPQLAATTLKVLAHRQGTRVDGFRDEEPGKILHESRLGEMTAFTERPHSPYYGSADGTPLFLVLLDEYERWTGDVDLVRLLEPNARMALRWIDEYSDRLGNGYVSYQRREETGLDNQCWKDSWNSILFRDGTLSKVPRACCEIQGYAYDAKIRCARLARKFWNDSAMADRLEREAASLKARFNRDFWMPERECYALAIDGDLRQVDSITSNIGHLLWSGIVDDDKAPHVVRHLMGPKLFSGWGIRTMAEGEGGYNPIGYHVGTVWPHDNSIIAWGLNRYGYRDESSTIASGILQAAKFFNYRLPEAFAGYPRRETQFPVEYPTACSPQAWATGAPALLIRTMLGLEPRGNRLTVDAALPPHIEWLEVSAIPGRWGTADAVGRRPTAPSVTAAEQAAAMAGE
jgi:glycogen debranching enzyme